MEVSRGLPEHVAIIMDGNGRWAQKRKLPRVMGHNAGMKSMKKIVRHASNIGIKYLTVYAFSTENWKRSEEEVSGIFKLLIKYVDSELNELAKENVKVNILGNIDRMPLKVQEKLKLTIESTKNNTGLNFNIALNYGARNEIVNAVREIVQNGVTVSDIDEDMISSYLYTGKHNIPDPDLVIRTSGEIRLSNFLMWQLAYSEMAFTDTLWPDFDEQEFDEILDGYKNRERRFGGRLK